ncbi:MAG: hypothetical protein QOE94_3075 [Mycobacterium sp.]|nr:hypothetical protein [Mycobacterium sp.]
MAQGEFAELVDGAVADAEDVRGGGGGDDFGQGGVGLLWCAALGQGAVGPGGVVALAEGVERACSWLMSVVGRGRGVSHRLRVW